MLAAVVAAVAGALRAAARTGNLRAGSRRLPRHNRAGFSTALPGARTMYRFKSKADGDVIMLAANGDQLLRLIGKDPSPQGIVEVADLPAAIAAIEAAVAASEAALKVARQEAAGDDPQGAPKHEVVSLRQRAWPLLEMLKRSLAERVVIVWGV
jgi:hypothetical protein